MTKSHLISGLLLAAASMTPSLPAKAAIPATSAEFFKMESSADAVTEPKANKVLERQFKRAAKKDCNVGTAPGFRQASIQFERIIIALSGLLLAAQPMRARLG